MSNVIKAVNVVVGDSPSPPPKSPKPSGGDAPAATPGENGDSPVSLLVRGLLNSVPLHVHQGAVARSMLKAARRDADEIVQVAEASRDAIVEQARQEGYDTGYDEGRREGQKSLQQQYVLLEQTADAIESARTELLNTHREDLVALATSLAGKMLRRSGGVDGDTARQLLLEMLPRTTGNRSVVVKLAAEDLAALRDGLDSLASLADAESVVEFVADERLSSGNVLVETERGTLDGTESARARRLAEYLLGVMEYDD